MLPASNQVRFVVGLFAMPRAGHYEMQLLLLLHPKRNLSDLGRHLCNGSAEANILQTMKLEKGLLFVSVLAKHNAKLMWMAWILDDLSLLAFVCDFSVHHYWTPTHNLNSQHNFDSRQLTTHKAKGSN